MTIRHWFSLLLLPALLAALSSSIWGADPPSGPEDAVLFKDESVNMHLYKNNYFGFGVAIPGNWHILLKNELLWCIHDPNLRRAINSRLCFPLLGITKYPAGKPGPKGESNSNLVLYAARLAGVAHKREEGAQDRVATSPSGLPPSLGKKVKEGEDLIR